jgi:formylglycine-generating enzyme required for sulfatase activity
VQRLIGVISASLIAVAACGGSTPSAAPSAPTTASAPASPSASAERPPACIEIGQIWISPADGVTLACVPAGTFAMGSDDTAVSSPRHEVRLSAYWIDRTEVTNARYQHCVDAGKCAPRSNLPGATGVASKTRDDYYFDPAFADYPVLIYTAEEAMAYCGCMGRSLPTEAQWEKAAGGLDGRRYPWGDTLDCDHASYLDCTTDTTPVDMPVAGASTYGALNMAGNVAEWVADFWADGYDPRAPVDDPTGPATGENRIRRGGGFASLSRDLLVTARLSGNPAHYFDGQMGFRCATSAGVP